MTNTEQYRSNMPANSSEDYHRLNIFLPYFDYEHSFLISETHIQQINPSKCVHANDEKINDREQILAEPLCFQS